MNINKKILIIFIININSSLCMLSRFSGYLRNFTNNLFPSLTFNKKNSFGSYTNNQKIEDLEKELKIAKEQFDKYWNQKDNNDFKFKMLAYYNNLIFSLLDKIDALKRDQNNNNNNKESIKQKIENIEKKIKEKEEKINEELKNIKKYDFEDKDDNIEKQKKLVIQQIILDYIQKLQTEIDLLLKELRIATDNLNENNSKNYYNNNSYNNNSYNNYTNNSYNSNTNNNNYTNNDNKSNENNNLNISQELKYAFNVLELQPTKNFQDIQRAYYEKLKLWHPDKNNGSKKSTEKTQEIILAYEILNKEYISNKKNS